MTMKKNKYISPAIYVHDLVIQHHLLNYSVKNVRNGGTTSYGDEDED